MSSSAPWQFSFEAIGTQWVIDIADPPTVDRTVFLKRLTDRIAAFDSVYSRFRSDSLVSAIAKKPGVYVVSADAQQLMDWYQQLYVFTGGMVTPLIGRAIEQTGYDAVYSLHPETVIEDVPAWEDALLYEFPNLTVRTPVVLDFGAAGKGYVVDILSHMIRHAGSNNFCVDGSGDIYVASDKNIPLRVALEDPEDTTKAIGVAEVVNASLCASSGNRRTWQGYTHILNPKLKKSPEDILATWVVADTALHADGLATALFLVEPDMLTPHVSFEYSILYTNRSVQFSKNFPGELFTIRP